MAIPKPQISGKSFLPRKRFDNGDELIGGSTSNLRSTSSFDDFDIFVLSWASRAGEMTDPQFFMCQLWLAMETVAWRWRGRWECDSQVSRHI